MDGICLGKSRSSFIRDGKERIPGKYFKDFYFIKRKKLTGVCNFFLWTKGWYYSWLN